jgi:adenosyl cobinamide kinase/adenosyl cobinamide phosphate guanylyltransferase
MEQRWGDRTLVVGPARSGKSLLAEHRMLSLGGELAYVATLERCSRNAGVIRRHQARRDDRWQVFELSGFPERDLRTLETALRLERPLLIDGLALLIARVGFDTKGRPMRWLNPLVVMLRDGLSARSCPWIVVDADAETLGKVTYSLHADVVRHVHGLLAFSTDARSLAVPRRPRCMR